MIILILNIILFIIGIILIEKFDGFIDGNDILYMTGIALVMITSVFLVVALMIFSTKIIYYNNFKIEYEEIKNIETSSTDIRDTNYTLKVVNINKEIELNKKYCNNFWIGIYYNKDIANLEKIVIERNNQNGNSNNK